jgi:glutamine amidotransferase
MITIIDYGMGNLGSVYNMFKRVGVKSQISSDIKEIEKADKLLLPGVGAFDNAIKRLKEMDLIPVLNYKALEQKIPILGICLGMQLLTNGSEEGKEKGLGWIAADTLKFNFEDNRLKIPHMGWNTVTQSNKSVLTDNLPEEPRFYFVHSYYVKVKDEKNSILKTNYGLEFDSAIQNGNIFGTQFHPEKSHKFGMKIFENFAKF